MKLIIKLAAIFLVLALFLPMWLKGPDGRPIMTPQDWLDLPGLTAKARVLLEKVPLPDMVSPAGPAADSPASATQPSAPSGQFYRWQDESGTWQFSDKPPEGQVLAAESLPQVSNSMQAVVVPEPEAEAAPQAGGTAAPMGSSITPSLPEGVSREAIEEMLQDAHERRMGEQL